jgi:hypothetical protein
MSREAINNNGLEDEALQELLDLFYVDSTRANLVKFCFWEKSARREVKDGSHCQRKGQRQQ